MVPDKVELAKRAFDAYNRRDLDTFFAELATPDFELLPALMGALEGSRSYRGRAGLEAFLADMGDSWEEHRVFPEEFYDLGESVLVLISVKGRGRVSGAPGGSQLAYIYDFRAGKIWRATACDRGEALRAAGLSE